MAEQAPTPLVAQRHPPVAAPAHIRHAVMLGEPFVEKGIVRAQQVDHAPVLAQLALDKQLGLALKGLAKVFVEQGKQVRVGGDAADPTQRQPLADEIVHERRRAPIGQHAPHLPLEHTRLGERAAGCDVEQLVVGEAAPEEERHPRSELEVAEPVGGARCHAVRVALDAEQELRVDQDAFERRLDARLEATLGAAGLVERK